MGQSFLPHPRTVILPNSGFRKPLRPGLFPNDPINRGLVGCWPLGYVGTAGLAQDISGNGLHGTLTSSPTLAPSHHGGRSLAFDGSATFVSIPASVLLGTSAISVSVWVKFAALTNAYSSVFSLVNGAANIFHQLMVKSTGKLAIFIHTTAGTLSYDGTGSNTLVTGTWYNIGMAYDGNSGYGIAGYVNGAVDHTVGPVNPLTTTSAVITTIGKDDHTAGRVVNGDIEGARQWSRFLTTTERLRLFSEPYAGMVDLAPMQRIVPQSPQSFPGDSYVFVNT